MPPSVVAVGVGKLAAERVPETPLAGTDVAAMVPEPVADKLAPVPMTMFAKVFVPAVSAEKPKAAAPGCSHE